MRRPGVRGTELCSEDGCWGTERRGDPGAGGTELCSDGFCRYAPSPQGFTPLENELGKRALSPRPGSRAHRKTTESIDSPP